MATYTVTRRVEVLDEAALMAYAKPLALDCGYDEESIADWTVEEALTFAFECAVSTADIGVEVIEAFCTKHYRQ